jgi:hypothetical protein
MKLKVGGGCQNLALKNVKKNEVEPRDPEPSSRRKGAVQRKAREGFLVRRGFCILETQVGFLEA